MLNAQIGKGAAKQSKLCSVKIQQIQAKNHEMFDFIHPRSRLRSTRREAGGASRVVSRTRKGSIAQLRLESGQVVQVRPFAAIGEGDLVKCSKDGTEISLVLDEGRFTIDITKPWSVTYFVDLGRERLKVVIKEVETEEELEALSTLKQFHYRGEKSAGRTAPLIAIASHHLLPPVVGFIEITSAMLVNTARKAVLDRAFADREHSVVWQRWDMATAKLHTRRLARISRCVVYPELRGLGIASRLAKAAAIYARDRWQFGGAKSIFLEITADMLRYSPFVANAGFVYVGDTEGNEERMLRDMRYLLKRTIASGSQGDFPQGGGGIMSLQRSYATMLLGVMGKRKLGLEQLLNVLRRSPENLSDDEWIALHKVFRRPKPTYMCGLTAAAKDHLKAVAPTRRKDGPTRAKVVKGTGSHMESLVLDAVGLKIATSVSPTGSPRSRKVAEAFGVVSKRLETTLVSDLNLSVLPGEIVLLTGPSGTGKSLLLRAFQARLTANGVMPSGVSVESTRLVGTDRVAWVSMVVGDRAPVDLLEQVSLEHALSLLGVAGLAESSLFVRPASTLSDGQRYRLSIACALASDPKLLLVDAFCEPLDDLSAAAVCKGLRALTRRSGVSAVVATAAPDRLLQALEPDVVLQLLPGRTFKTHRKLAPPEA